jgi:TonB-dependent receptor
MKRTAMAVGVAQAIVCWSSAWAQSGDATTTQVVVTGQRAALESAQRIKQQADEVVDSIVADDIGKLPDRSVTEVLQRVVGVAIDRTMARNDPGHFSVEGSGVVVRGLSYVRSELNGRDSFSANGGRSLNFEDVPPELMAGVDVYKNPSAEQVEGAVSGLINLRTAMPFDFKGARASVSVKGSYNELGGKTKPEGSVLLSNRWDTDYGKIGALVDVAYSESSSRSDSFTVGSYYPVDNMAGQDGRRWVPGGPGWNTLTFDRKRTGIYGALQWKNANWASSLTYFRSKYNMYWDETGIGSGVSPYDIKIQNGKFDANGVFQSGLMTNGNGPGFTMNDDTRFANRTSRTEELAWNLAWSDGNRWSFKTDFQYVRANTHAFDSTVGVGTQVPKVGLDVTTSPPSLSFDDGDRAYISNPNNYYWSFMMEHLDKSTASEKAWRGDAKFQFDDPVLRDLRFGLRLTARDAETVNSDPSYHWARITNPWQGGELSGLAYLGDPRFSGPTRLGSIDNFFNGRAAAPPQAVFPSFDVAAGYPSSYALLESYRQMLCTSKPCPDPWSPAPFGTTPQSRNTQSERTQAAYGMLRFGFDNLRFPVDGNVGLRLVHTKGTAQGYMTFQPMSGNLPAGVPVMTPFSQAQEASNSYTNVLPSLNLKMNGTDKLQFRFAYARGISRPDFSQLQSYTSLSQSAQLDTVNGQPVLKGPVSYTGTASGNPSLKPIRAENVDLTAEWYPKSSTSVTLAVFNKKLKDIIVNQSFIQTLDDVAGTPHNFIVTGPANGARGRVSGIELAGQTYFDWLPGWMSGFGISANYTYIDSRQDLYNPTSAVYCAPTNAVTNFNLYQNGCDTDGKTIGKLPMMYLSKNGYNLNLLFDKGPVSARVAYSWRGRYLQSVSANGTTGTDALNSDPSSPTFGQHNVAYGLPYWANGYGTVDASFFYKFGERVQLGIEASNLTNALYTQVRQQGIGFMGSNWNATGRRLSVALRYSL